MKHSIAFAGLRHPHIFSLWDKAAVHPGCEIVAACEPDAATREALSAEGKYAVTHENFSHMLEETGCTIVAIGDVYADRGSLAIAALKAGRHVILDKPICTSLQELDELERLARAGNVAVGCQLDLVEEPGVRALRSVIASGAIGRVCTITTLAQHPLRYGVRAGWYFEPGRHGGTINDIGIHLIDMAPWLTGSPWKETLLAREWNAKAIQEPHFRDCAQFYGVLEDGTACFTDVSYLAPDKAGYSLPQYWRLTVHGTKGLAETSYGKPCAAVTTDDDSATRDVAAPAEAARGYLQDFLDEIDGNPDPDGITTARVIRSARNALQAQEHASRRD